MKITWKEDGFYGGKGISADRGKPKRPGYTRQTGSIDHIKYFSEETLGTPQEFSWSHTNHIFARKRSGFRGEARGQEGAP